MSTDSIVVTTLRVPKAEWQTWKRQAALAGVSTHQYILDAVREYRSQPAVEHLPRLSELLRLADDLHIHGSKGRDSHV
jgi:hypothetical protein